jgi:TRAP transporter T-component
VIATAIPPALGGRTEVGREHFEKALALSQGHNLMVKVYYAKNYARGVFDRELHDRLLNEVLAADPHQTGWTLSNLKAQEEASALLASADEYF